MGAGKMTNATILKIAIHMKCRKNTAAQQQNKYMYKILKRCILMSERGGGTK